MTDWRETIEEQIRLEINEAIQEWRGAAYLTLNDFTESEPLTVEMRIPEYDDGFIDDVVRPRRTLADLLREYVRLTGQFLSHETADEELLSNVPSGYHPHERRKLKFGQDLLRLVLEFDEERKQWESDTE
jgi:hypothetical protein